ncbi:response regulator SirA [Streptococcus pyogenes]|uniref:Response regulator SirA n=1 Tax=Streptococcus pyogenes TaxID=1314 RepID=A0A660A7X3_STRPY|nr:response regulator SirA [Streptococcus pyogenes]AZA32769.1 response regulator SirA [Streptococcus pyogenes]AZA34562.1 response regulator SirA [Streptococcus pyogenes]QCK58577.1 response regulator SirA [Streptococcus pyogenes]RXS23957.1 response regulator SirA [Streptococcus pyogenes]
MSLPCYCQERYFFDCIFHQISVFENDFLRKYCFKAISKGFGFSPKTIRFDFYF